MNITVRVDDAQFLAGTVVARGVKVGPTPPGLATRIDGLVAQRGAEEFPPASLKEAIRNLLRRGGFRPAGRNKPSSEYLAQAAREGRFPRINNLVNIINLLSLESGLPISLLDLAAVGEDAEIRRGKKGEKYIFNVSGQELDLGGLACVCRVESSVGIPLGSPIKDSMAGKINESTTEVIGVVYASMAVVDSATMDGYLAQFESLLREYSGGAGATYELKLALRATG